MLVKNLFITVDSYMRPQFWVPHITIAIAICIYSNKYNCQYSYIK